MEFTESPSGRAVETPVFEGSVNSRDRGQQAPYHAPMTYTTFDLSGLESIDRYKLLSGLVVPRPIGWIGTRAEDGTHNLAPYSFFNLVSANPPTVIFSAGRRRGAPKDTSANVRATGEFTVNIVTEDTTAAMNVTAGDVGPDVDEFRLAGLTAVGGERVDAPRVGEAAASLECVLSQTIELADPPTNTIFVGSVLVVHVRSGVLEGTRVDHKAFRAVGRLAGSDYVTTADSIFSLERPG